MLEKSEVPTLLQNFCAMAVRQFGSTVKTFRTDNRTEFMKLKPFLRKEGILHHTSSVDTPQQNGRVERKHRHILNVACACLFQANLPVTFWGHSILTAAHLINRTPSRLLGGKSPYQLLHGSAPRYNTLRVFGCLCFAQKCPKNQDKFATRSHRCLFVGYPHGKNAWNVYDIENNKFFTSRDDVFFEDQFPGPNKLQPPNSLPPPSPAPVDTTSTDDWSIPPTVSETAQPALPTTNIPITVIPTDSSVPTPSHELLPTDSTTSSPTEIPPSPITESPETSQPITLLPSSPTSDQTESNNEPQSPGLPELLGRGHRQRQPSVLLKNYVTNAAQKNIHTPLSPPDSSLGSSTSVSGNTLYPI